MIYKLPKGSRRKLSRNFSADEFECHCGKCRETIIDSDLIDGLQIVRDKIGMPVVVVSGYRCHAHNKKVGGVKNSQHLIGRAADIMVYSKTPHRVAKLCQHFKGVGVYPKLGFVHCDVRAGKRARW